MVPLTLKIGGKQVGVGQPIFVIAEAGVNHNGSLELAQKMVDAAVNAGADAIKFQTFNAEDICTIDAEQAEYQVKNTGQKESQLAMLKRLELTPEAHAELKQYCDQKGIIFCSTPHSSIKDVDLLDPYVPFFKVASGDLTNLPFLAYIAQKQKPIVLATGMGTLAEVQEAYNCAVKEGNSEIILVHATSNYPFEPEETNLKAMNTLKNEIGALTGYSDNGNRFDVPLLAALMGATVIEKHFTLDKNLPGPDHISSFDPLELKTLIQGIRYIENMLKSRGFIELTFPADIQQALNEVAVAIGISIDDSLIPTLLGDGIKKPTPAELKIAQMARKSIVTARDFSVGDIIQEKDLVVKRPGTGISPSVLYFQKELIVGQRLKSSLSKDQLLSFDHLENDSINGNDNTSSNYVNNHFKSRKVLYISGTRADYGLMKNTLLQIQQHPALKLEIIATGIHLMPEFGNTVDEIKKDGFTVFEVPAVFEGDTTESMGLFLGKFIQKVVPLISSLKPDFILVLGDRVEMFGAVAAGTYLSIPIAHIHGGDISSTVDDIARHAITKLAHLHFPATELSAKRIQSLGEENWRIQVVGAPGLDSILHESRKSKLDLETFFQIDLSKPVIICVQHAVTLEADQAGLQMVETLEALKKAGYQSIIVYPNADAGGRKIIRIIEKYRDAPNFKIFKHIERNLFIGLMSQASAMVGNSSSGIIEAASFKLPVINIGTRQQGRERGNNVIDVNYDHQKIMDGIAQVLSPNFKINLNGNNPYGDGKAGEKIAQAISAINIDRDLLEKKLVARK